MFKFMNNQNKSIKILAPSEGYLKELETSSDEAFRSKVLGDGFYIKMSDSKIYAPIDGLIVSIFPTNHAYCISGTSGLEIMVHIGINTNNLQKGIIESNIKKGYQVKKGDLLAEIDLNIFKRLGIEPEVYVFILNKDLMIDKDYRSDNDYIYDGDCVLEMKV